MLGAYSLSQIVFLEEVKKKNLGSQRELKTKQFSSLCISAWVKKNNENTYTYACYKTGPCVKV